ncbi:glycosyltransferase family 2 protein [Anaerolineales bacterium]
MIYINTLPLSLWFFFYSTWWLYLFVIYSIFHLSFEMFPTLTPGQRQRFFVILIPCHNEELVIENTIESLMTLDYPPENYLILVIDDASQDRTGVIVQGLTGRYPNLQLLQRSPEQGGKGKSEALNAGYRHLLASDLLSAHEDYVVGVCDADGRLDANMLWSAEALFAQENVGACQSGVRVRGREESFALRLQDMEFCLYSYITQSIRSRCLGNASLGGNGQFISKEALASVKYTHEGRDYWWDPDALTEDLEIGLRIIMKEYRVLAIPHSFVHQQGLTHMKKLIFRQRTRWAWGTLQVASSYLLNPKFYLSSKLSLVQKFDWFILLTLWGISVTLPLVWLLTILHIIGLISVGTPIQLLGALFVGFAWVPLIIFGLLEIKEYRRWRTVLWALGFYWYLMHGIIIYYYALLKLLILTPTWDKTERSVELE